MSIVYLDGAFVPEAEARLRADDAAFLYGRGLFETFRARNGLVFLLDRHVERLRHGARVLSIAPAPDIGLVREAVAELTRRLGLDDARVRLTLTAGPRAGKPSLLIQARAATDYAPETYERGMTAVVATVSRNETSPLSRIKSLNYLGNLLAREEASAAGADEAILLNTRGLVAEGAAANVFAVRGGELLTAPVEDGALPGVTRAAILQLTQEAGVSAREAPLTLDELRLTDEAFLTNAVMGMMPLVALDGVAIGGGTPGAVTRRLRALYEEAVEKATRRAARR